MDSEHANFIENIPAYALGALDADDVAALEAHLLTCESCRRELAEYRLVSENLMAALPPRQPPAALRSRLRRSIPRKAPRARLAWSFGQLALGAALALLLAFNILSFVQMQSFQRQQAALLHQVKNDQTALAMLAYPGTQSIPIQGSTVAGTILLDRDRNAVMLIAWDLPALPENETYQAWLVQPDGVRVSAGVFRPGGDGGSYTAQPLWPDRSLSTFSGLGVTIEPAGGSPQPTGERLFKVDF